MAKFKGNGGGAGWGPLAAAVGIAIAEGIHIASQSNEISATKAQKNQVEAERNAWRNEAMQSRDDKKNLINSLNKSNQALNDAQGHIGRVETALVAAEQGKAEFARQLAIKDRALLQANADREAQARKIAELEAKLNGPKA